MTLGEIALHFLDEWECLVFCLIIYLLKIAKIRSAYLIEREERYLGDFVDFCPIQIPHHFSLGNHCQVIAPNDIHNPKEAQDVSLMLGPCTKGLRRGLLRFFFA